MAVIQEILWLGMVLQMCLSCVFFAKSWSYFHNMIKHFISFAPVGDSMVWNGLAFSWSLLDMFYSIWHNRTLKPVCFLVSSLIPDREIVLLIIFSNSSMIDSLINPQLVRANWWWSCLFNPVYVALIWNPLNIYDLNQFRTLERIILLKYESLDIVFCNLDCHLPGLSILVSKNELVSPCAVRKSKRSAACLCRDDVWKAASLKYTFTVTL